MNHLQFLGIIIQVSNRKLAPEREKENSKFRKTEDADIEAL